MPQISINYNSDKAAMHCPQGVALKLIASMLGWFVKEGLTLQILTLQKLGVTRDMFIVKSDKNT